MQSISNIPVKKYKNIYVNYELSILKFLRLFYKEKKRCKKLVVSWAKINRIVLIVGLQGKSLMMNCPFNVFLRVFLV